MKKIKFFIVMILIFSLTLLASCVKYDLETPTGFSVDENNTLSWTVDESARSYVIEIKDLWHGGEIIEKTSKKASYSLSVLEEGDYEIRVRALGGSAKDQLSSAWSETFSFHKDYETGCIYTLINGNTEYEITKVGSASGDVYIEDTYRGKPVTSIADGAFKNSRLVQNVTLGNKIKSIGENAFYNCSNLVSINIPDSVTSIGNGAFQSCRSLRGITLSENVETLGEYTFAYCRAMTEVTLSEGLKKIGESAFANCSALEKITIPDSVTSVSEYAFSECTALTELTLGSGLKTIGDYAFFQCTALSDVRFAQESALTSLGVHAFSECKSITALSLPEGLTTIGNNCFYSCENLSEVNIPKSVDSVGSFCFNNTKIYKNQYEDGFIYADDWLVAITQEKKAEIKELTEADFKDGVYGIAGQVFSACSQLESVKLPASLRVIGEGAFYFCPYLYKINTPDESVKKICASAFSNCPLLSNVTLGIGLETIEDYAFYSCASLDNKDAAMGGSIIPSSVKSIGYRAFYGTALWNKPSEYGIVYAGDWVVGYNFSYLSAMDQLIISFGGSIPVSLKAGVAGISRYAFYNCTGIDSVTGLANVTNICVGAFAGCSNLTVVSLNRNLRTIEPYTFYKCSSLGNITLPSNLREIGRYSFYKCELLSAVDLSESRVETIGERAFYGCSNLKKLTFAEGADGYLESIGAYSFYKCSALESLRIPDSVTNIGTRAFGKCESLKSLTLGNGIEEIKEYAFYGCTSLQNIAIPDSVKTIGAYAFYKCAAAETLTLGNNLEKIEKYAFSGLEKIKVLVIPQSVKSIGSCAFRNCKALTSVVLNAEIDSLDSNVFYGCKQMTFYSERASSSENWNLRWNSSYRPVVWNCSLSEDKTYVVSVSIGENSVSNATAKDGVAAPVRAGYAFVGWATEPDSATVAYTADEIAQAPAGSVLYSVWELAPEESDEPAEDAPEAEGEPEEQA